MNGISSANLLAGTALRLMAANYNHRSSLRDYLRGNGSWLDFKIGFRTESGSVEQALISHDGKMKVSGSIPADVDAMMILSGDDVIMNILSVPPNELLNMLLKSRYRVEGNLTYLTLFNFYVAMVTGKMNRKRLEKQKRADAEERLRQCPDPDPELRKEMAKRRKELLRGEKTDPGVKLPRGPLPLASTSLEDFPRLERFLDIHFTRSRRSATSGPSCSPTGSWRTASRRTRRASPGSRSCGRATPSST